MNNCVVLEFVVRTVFIFPMIVLVDGARAITDPDGHVFLGKSRSTS
jgi:hypothetical protein